MDALLAWWLQPLSGAAHHALEPALAWHGRSMVAAWGVLVPLGALLARFFKVLPGQDWPRELDNPAWWHGHRLLLTLAVVLMLVGTALLWGRPAGAGGAVAVHRWLGLLLLGAGVVQVGLGLMRGTKGGPTDRTLRGDHYDMTPRRVRFERLHKSLGWGAWALSVVAIVLGLVVADAPRWMVLALALWWAALAAGFVALQRAGCCLDTYQAIWGPDPAHPGNSRAAVGWGITRLQPGSRHSPFRRRRRT